MAEDSRWYFEVNFKTDLEGRYEPMVTTFVKLSIFPSLVFAVNKLSMCDGINIAVDTFP